MADESGAGNTSTKYTNDPQQIVNMSVWETAEALEHFVWNTAHKRIYSQKHSWFEKPAQAIFVMWPVEEGRIPTLTQGMARLRYLRERGPSNHAYGWEGLGRLKVWMNQKCG